MPMDAASGIAESTKLLGDTSKQIQAGNQNPANEEFIDKAILSSNDNAYKMAITNQRTKALLLSKQLQGENAMALEKVKAQNMQDLEGVKSENKKAEIDYRDFMTMTPELAEGIYKSTKGRLDFRKNVGQRYQTKVIIPLAQMYGRQIEAGIRGSGRGGASSKDLNALKAFTKQYEGVEKEYSGMNLQLKEGIGKRNPKVQQQISEKMQFLKDHKDEYAEAVKKIGSMGGVDTSSDDSDNGDDGTPPATSSSDEDALIDKAFSE